MEALVRPLLSDKYEVARELLIGLLEKGLISKIEFDAIDRVNKKSFALEMT